MCGKKYSAFTLLEVVVVIVIIGVLASLGFGQYTKAVRKSVWAEAYRNCEALARAVYVYYIEHDAWPGDSEPGETQLIPEGMAIEVPQSKNWMYQIHKHDDRGDARANLIDSDKWGIPVSGGNYVGIEVKVYTDGTKKYSYCKPGNCSFEQNYSGWAR